MMKLESDLMALMAQQIDLLQDLACADGAAHLAAAQHRLQDQGINVVLIGEYSRGKSTLLNALLGKEILVVSAVPVPTINRVVRRDRPTAHINDANGQPQAVPLPDLQAGDYGEVEVGYPLSWLPPEVTLIEQPTLTEQPAAFATAVTQADLVVMVIASDALYSTTERQAFEYIKAAGHRRVLFVCNFSDRIPPAELANLQQAAYVRLPVNPDQIFFLSAGKAMQGEPQALGELEQFKGALLKEVAIGETALKRARAERLLQQSLEIAETAIAQQQSAQSQQQAAVQSQRRDWQLAYEDTAAIGRNLEADLSEFRQRTGEVVQTMTNTFIRNLAQQTASWIETVEEPLSQRAIANHLHVAVQRWQQTELEPYLKAQMSHQAATLQTQSEAFMRRLNQLYERLGNVEPAAALSLNLGDLPVDEVRLEVRELPLAETDEPPSELLNPSNIVLSVAVVAATLLVIRPFFLAIPASLAGLGATTFFTMNRSQSQKQSTRRQLARAYEQVIRRQADPVSLQILNAIHTRLDQLQNHVRSQLNARLKPVQLYLQDPLASPTADTANYQGRLQAIEQTFHRLFAP